MTLSKVQILRKSFLPVVIVTAALFLLLFSIELKVAIDQNRVTVIEIERAPLLAESSAHRHHEYIEVG